MNGLYNIDIIKQELENLIPSISEDFTFEVLQPSTLFYMEQVVSEQLRAKGFYNFKITANIGPRNNIWLSVEPRVDVTRVSAWGQEYEDE